MKFRKFIGWLAAAAAAVMPWTAGAQALPPSTNLPVSDADIAFWTANAVQQFQFTRHPFDAEISGRFLDRYLEGLDYYHLLFLQSDLREFDVYRNVLQFYTMDKRDVSPGFKIFDRMLERATEREAYETNVLWTEPFVFTNQEKFIPDRHDLTNPATMSEATNLWHEEVRLDFLNEKLAQKVGYFGPVAYEGQSNWLATLVRKTTNASSFEFLPVSFHDADGHVFGRLDPASVTATNAKIHLQLPAGANLLKIINHFYGEGGRDWGLIRFEPVSDTNDAPTRWNDATGKSCDLIIELKTNDTLKIQQLLQKRYSLALKNARSMTSDGHVLESYLTALARAYDPHSDYFGRAEADNFKIRMGGSLVGIGARLSKTLDDQCEVEDVIAGGPAQLDGQLKPKDLIIAVAQKGQDPVPVDGMPLEEVVDKIRGLNGTQVTLTVERESSIRPKVITLTRRKVELAEEQCVGKLYDGLPKIGVVDIPSFYAETEAEDPGAGPPHERKTVTRDVATLVRRLKKENAQGIILDLRTNGGGYLDEAIKLTGLFNGKGPVVQTKSPDGEIVTDNATNATPLYDGPLIVLVSRMSASASEILAGALQDYGRAIIIGDKTTFGKGTVQTVQPLTAFIPGWHDGPTPSLGSLHLTIKKFYRASGLTTESNGVASDIVLPSILNYANMSESSQPNWLPADTVSSADLPPNLNLVKPYVAELQQRSEARRAKNKDFAYLQEDIDEYRKHQDDKSVSLNEADRLKEQKDADARGEMRKKERDARPKVEEKFYELTVKNAEEPGLTLHKPPVKPPQDPNAAPEDPDATPDDPVANDMILTEARRIMADYIELLKKPVAAISTAP